MNPARRELDNYHLHQGIPVDYHASGQTHRLHSFPLIPSPNYNKAGIKITFLLTCRDNGTATRWGITRVRLCDMDYV
jgi:hypothetical protein